MTLSGSWELWDGGRRWLTLRERRWSLEAARAALEAERRRVENLAVSSYFGVLQSTALTKVEEKNVRLTAEQAALARRLFERGARGLGDVLKAEVSARRARIAKVQAVSSDRDAITRLNTLLGRGPDGKLELEPAPEAVEAPQQLSGYLSLAEGGRPEIIRTFHSYHSASYSLRRAVGLPWR